MATDQFSLQWDNFHKNMSAGMQSLLESEDLVDVTLAVEGRHLKAHKMVLSLCSPYFRELFQTNPCKHPIVFMKDVSYIALSDLLQFMYQGEVQVAQENLSTFIKTAEALQIKGLTGDSNNQLEDPLETFEVEKQKATVQYVKRTHEVANVETTPSAPRVKKTAAPIPKRARYSRSSTTNVISNAPVEEPIEAIESHDTATTSALEHIIQMKSEPGDIGTESIQVKGADESEVQDFMEDTLGDDDTEDYSLMEHTEDDPKPGTSSDGVGDGQGFRFKMAKRIRKSDEEIRDALDAVVNKKLSIRRVAKNTGISKSMLAVLVKKVKDAPDEGFIYNRNIGNRKTFTKEQEELLVSDLKSTSKMCHGLTTIQIRELAYHFCVANKIPTPAQWIKSKKAGIQWLRGFMKRNKELSLRRSEVNP